MQQPPNSGVVTNDLLVEDMEQQKERRDELGEKLRGLRCETLNPKP